MVNFFWIFWVKNPYKKLVNLCSQPLSIKVLSSNFLLCVVTSNIPLKVSEIMAKLSQNWKKIQNFEDQILTLILAIFKLMVQSIQKPSQELDRIYTLLQCEHLSRFQTDCLEQFMRTNMTLEILIIWDLFDELRHPACQQSTIL